MFQNPSSARSQAHSSSVKEYDVRTGTLALDRPQPSAPGEIVAEVNIDHVLETIKALDMEVGAWLNVMGYVKETKPPVPPPTAQGYRSEDIPIKRVSVQAIAVWSAGDIDLEAYEKAVRERQFAR
jgi:hypothetical protein